MGSWIWRKLLKLRPIAQEYIRVQIRSGEQTFFWHDRWVGESRLWNSSIPNLTNQFGIALQARVSEAHASEGWLLRRPRNPALNSTFEKVLNGPAPSEGEDQFLWKTSTNKYIPKFSALETWKQYRGKNPSVSWAKLIKFPLAIPKQSFVVWMALKDCLPTGEKMRTWGREQHCVFCGEWNETRDHLFFGCPYSFQAWVSLAGNLIPRKISPDWKETIKTLENNKLVRIDSLMLRLALQTLIYSLWRERNDRIHKNKTMSFQNLTRLVSKLITDKLRAQYKNDEEESVILNRWERHYERGLAFNFNS